MVSNVWERRIIQYEMPEERVCWSLRTPVDLSFLTEPSPPPPFRFEGLKLLPAQRSE